MCVCGTFACAHDGDGACVSYCTEEKRKRRCVMRGRKINCETNEAWRRERSKSVGASAVGAILGVSHFKTACQLAERMRAELRGEFDYTQTLAMMRGHAYEGGVAALFEWSSGQKVIQSSSEEYLVRCDDMPFMHASPDRIYWRDYESVRHGRDSELNKGVLECKTTRRTVKPDKLPLSWLLQLQVQMGLTGYHEGYLAWDVLSKTEGFGYAWYNYNKEVFDAIAAVCKEFWYRTVVGGKEPRSRDYLMREWPILYSDSWTKPRGAFMATKGYVRKAVDGSEKTFPYRPMYPIDDELENEIIEREEKKQRRGFLETMSWFGKILEGVSK